MVLTKDFIRKQVEFMEVNPTVGAAQSEYQWFDSESLIASLNNMESLINRKTLSKSKEVKWLGTGGSVFRKDAVNQVGGFDQNIKGASEDVDITARIKEAGWSLCLTQVKWYHRYSDTWKSLWAKFVWYGYGIHYVHHKHKNLISLGGAFPPIRFIVAIRHSIIGFRLHPQKLLFLLPIKEVFEFSAMWYGFIKSHLNGHGHQK